MTKTEIVNIGGETYEKRNCSPCGGTGEVHDSTLADKVCAEGSFKAECARCRGRGFTTHSTKLIEVEAEARAAVTAPDFIENTTPAWML